jgi:oxygen-independent coproporphyrinogen-3 oxidase
MSIGLYIHVPFCLKKCSYCDFVSYVYEPALAREYRTALIKEMELYSKRLPAGDKEVETLFIGGGTPTCLSTDDLVTILESCHYHFHLLPGAEISMEANTGTVDVEKLLAAHRAGVNRLSLGVQACQKRLLKLLGRIHSFSDAVEAVQAARQAGFINFSMDLIFGIPGQEPEEWRYCLEQVTVLAPTHISTYGLQLEEDTPLWQEMQAGKIEPCSEEVELKMYEQAMEMLKTAGFEHYEISNFALPGYQCRHNLRYWHNLPYLGLGPAAYSYLDHKRFNNEVSPGKYVHRIMTGELAVVEPEELPLCTSMAETMILGLRLLEGLDLNAFAARFGRQVEEVFAGQIRRLLELGLVEFGEGVLRLTHKGLPVANRVFVEFV